MKITKQQLRKIIEEESKREFPIYLYSDEELMNEGLLDFLKGLFGKVVGFFKDAWKEATGEVAGEMQQATGDVATIAKDMGVKNVSSVEDLNVSKDDKHRDVLFRSQLKLQKQFIQEQQGRLDQLNQVKDWTPKSESDADAESWKKAEGDKAKSLFEAVGTQLGICNFYAKHGVDAASKSVSAAQAALEKGNWSPAAGIQALMSLAATTASLYNVVEKSDEVVAKAGLAKEWSQIAQGAKAIGQKIAGDAKEQQKEWVELRKFVNATIIVEARRKK